MITAPHRAAPGVHWRSVAVFMSLLLVLAGCAIAPSQETSPATTVLPRAPVDLTPWSAKGKLSIQGPQGSETARFHWQRPDADHDTIVLSGPMSLNQQTIQRKGKQTLWLDGDTERPVSELAGSPLFLSDTALISPAALGTWLLGAPSPSTEWTVKVTQWQEAGEWKAPSRVTIRHVDMEIKVIITKWDFSTLP